MKYFLTYIILFFLLVPVVAQTSINSADLYIGPELSLGSDRNVPQIFGHDENRYYAATFDHRQGISSFDKNLQIMESTHLDLMDGLRTRTYIGMCYFHDSIYLFTQEVRIKSVLLFVETIDKETMLQNKDIRILMDIPNMAGWESDYGFKLSRQKEKLLVYSRLDALSKNIQDVKMLMFGEGFRLEWQAEEKVIYPRSPPRQSIIKVSDDGDAYFISLLDDQNLRSLWDGIRNRYHMIAVTENGRYVNSYAMSLQQLYIRGVQIEPGDNHRLVVTGFYSPTHFRGNIDGVFYFELDNRSGEFLNRNLFEFNPKILKEAISEKTKGEPDELFDFRVKQLIRRNNGDFIMLAENEYDQSYDTYQNILAASISPGGRFNWITVIPKRQGIDSRGGANFSSYYVHAPRNSDNIYIIFNDNDKNETLPLGERRKSFYPNKKAILNAVCLFPGGTTSTAILYRKTNPRMKNAIPMQSYDMLNNEVVIPYLRLKRYEFMKVTFND